MKKNKYLAFSLLIAFILPTISNGFANEGILGAWNSLDGEIKFLSKNRYRSTTGEIYEWHYAEINNILIRGLKYQFIIETNINSGMQFLRLISNTKNEERSELSYYRKIPTRKIDRDLLTAVLNQNTKTVESLINAGANPYTTDYDIGNKTPAYQLAINLKNSELIKIFLPHTRKIMFKEFFHAIDNRDYSTSRAFLSAKVDPNVTDNMHSTPLMHAAALGDIKLAKLLINAGAKINNVDGHGKSTLNYANNAKNNKNELIKLLLTHCPDCD